MIANGSGHQRSGRPGAASSITCGVRSLDLPASRTCRRGGADKGAGSCTSRPRVPTRGRDWVSATLEARRSDLADGFRAMRSDQRAPAVDRDIHHPGFLATKQSLERLSCSRPRGRMVQPGRSAASRCLNSSGVISSYIRSSRQGDWAAAIARAAGPWRGHSARCPGRPQGPGRPMPEREGASKSGAPGRPAVPWYPRVAYEPAWR